MNVLVFSVRLFLLYMMSFEILIPGLPVALVLYGLRIYWFIVFSC